MGKTHEELIKDQSNAARQNLSNFAGRAVEILQELAELGDNDRIRLSAANSILDRVGVVAPTETRITVAPEEHQIARDEAIELMERIKENSQPASLPTPQHSIEAVIVHEGEEVQTTASTEETT